MRQVTRSRFQGVPEHDGMLLDEAREDPIALVCHRLRTPLTSSLGFIQLLLRDARRQPGSQAQVHSLELVDEQLRRMAGMIDQLAATGERHRAS